ncbi:MAG: FecR domain-containing protein [Arenicella sp.]|nr:FecR domain-containing protein [Arenicella sp.]
MNDKKRILDEAAEWILRLDESNDSNFAVSEWRSWMDRSPEHHRAFKKMLDLWGRADELVVLESSTDREHVEAKTKNNWHWGMAIAASLLIVPVVSYMLILFQFNQPNDVLFSATYHTGKKEHFGVVLPDGSAIELGADTHVEISYNGSSRHATLLSGESFFKVAKDSNRPFRVYSDTSVTQAVGTAFNVHAGFKETTVTVTEGTVRVRALLSNDIGSKPVSGAAYSTLIVGEAVRVKNDGVLGQVVKIDPARETSRRQGRLTFVDRDLISVITDLNRYSDREIEIRGDKVSRLRFSGMVRQDGIDEWLEALPQVFDVRLVQQSSGVLITETKPL